MKTKRSTPTSDIITVTPAIAQEFLMLNDNNRPIRKERVENYLDQMKKGLWDVQNDDICFDTEGKLMNGQHRLSAVIKFGKPVEMGVKFGLNPRTFAIMDQGGNRTGGDIFAISGIKNGNAKASIVKFYLQFRKGKYLDKGGLVRYKIGNNEILTYAEKNAKRLDEIYNYNAKIYKQFKPIPARYLGAIYWVLADIDQQSANDFFELYGSGVGLAANHPIYVLRTKLLSDMNSIKKYQITDKLIWVVLAWNYYRQGKTITRFKYDFKEGEYPKPI